MTRWDGHTTKKHAITGEDVPDPDARVPVYTFTKPRPAKWPQADYIVGNPPFIGDKRMRDALGEGYVEALRDAYDGIVPGSCDFVMFWWQKAASTASKGDAKRFGLISTNSVTQKFNRRVIEDLMTAKKPVSLVFAVPDHPWVDSADGAAVRISMTVGTSGKKDGILATVTSEIDGEDEVSVRLLTSTGKIHADLTVGANATAAAILQAGEGLACNGVQLSGMGFAVERERAKELGVGTVDGATEVIRRYRNGKDLMATVRDVFVIDFFGLSEDEARRKFPAAYQHVLRTVKPERDQNNRETYRRNWWIFAEPRGNFRPALLGLPRYIATCRTAKHRVFSFLESDIIPDAKVIAIALGDAYHLGILSSTIHTHWAQSTGGWLGVGNDSNYNHSECFVKFPFPASTPAQQEKIRAVGEQLDAHRKRQQALYPELTMTGMYNVLERVRELDAAGSAPQPSAAPVASTHRVDNDGAVPLNPKEKKIYEQGLIGILKQLHDELDAAVAEAYGWSDPSGEMRPHPQPLSTGEMRPHPQPLSGGEGGLTRDEILTRLVALNAERAAEEAKGVVRWLRPEYQAKSAGAGAGAKGKQTALEVETAPAPALAPATAPGLRDWPTELPAQATALRAVLHEVEALSTLEEIAAHFGKPNKKRLAEIERLLQTMVAMGGAKVWNGKWVGV